MPKKIGPKKRKKIAIKRQKKRAREEEARAQLVAKSTEEKTKLDEESKILGRQRVKRPERNPKRPNRFAGCNEPPQPPPQLLDAIHEFLLDYRYIKAAHGMRTDNQNRPGHSQDVWKWTSKGLPFLSDLFIQWKDQNPETVQASAVERKRWLIERERWKAETNEAKRQKREIKRKRRDLKLEAARQELEKDFDAVARTKEKLRKAEKEQQRLDGYSVSGSDDEDENGASKGKSGKMQPGIPEQTNKPLESGSVSDDESVSGSLDSEWSDEDESDEDVPKANKSAVKSATSKEVKPTVNGNAAASKPNTEDETRDQSTASSSSLSSSGDEKYTKPLLNGTNKTNSVPASKAAPSSSSSSSSDSSDEAIISKPSTNNVSKSVAKPIAKKPASSTTSWTSSDEAPTTKPSLKGTSKTKRKPASSSSSSSSTSSDSESDVKAAAPPQTTATTTSKKRKAPSPSSSSSSSSSDSDAGGALVPKKIKTEPSIDAKPVVNGAVASTKNLSKPFSRIPDNITVKSEFASNEYIPDSYGQRAHDDLSVVKGKGFTKEKNKKKRGQGFRGGRIDIAANSAVRFED